MSGFYEAVYAMVALIPSGRVATYGEVASWSGNPRAARQVGFALGRLAESSAVPWHRVVNGRGEISARALRAGCEELQADLLANEGVTGDERGRINLQRFGWSGPDENPH